MLVIGIDAHKHTHTLVLSDEHGRKLGQRTIAARTGDHLAVLAWVDGYDDERLWAVEDCRHLSRRLEQDLLGAGERIVRVPPKLMAHARASGREFGKSDEIDALAVARAALREPHLPSAQLDGPERELRLLVDHRDHLVQERTRLSNRLRWHLHELDPDQQPPAGALTRQRTLTQLAARLEHQQGIVARLAREIIERCRQLTHEITALTSEIKDRVTPLAPNLLSVCGCSHLTAAKIIGETANIHRFRSPDAYARHNGTAPLPVSSAGRPHHRLSRTGNRQLNAALHRIAITQTQHHPDAKAMIARRTTNGDSPREARRILKRRLSDTVYRALKADTPPPN